MKIKSVCLSPLRVTVGARLARPVHRADGKLLLPSGTELDAEQLRNLQERGIEFVHVEIEDARDEAQIATDLAAAQARVTDLFRGASGEAREELRAAVLAYRCAAAS